MGDMELGTGIVFTPPAETRENEESPMRCSLFAVVLLHLAIPATAADGHAPTGSKLVPGTTLVYRVYGGQRSSYEDIYHPDDLPDYHFGHVTCNLTAAGAGRFKVDCEYSDLSMSESRSFWHNDSTYGWTSEGLVRYPRDEPPEVMIPTSTKGQKSAELHADKVRVLGKDARGLCYQTNVPDDDPGDIPEIGYCLTTEYGPVRADGTSTMGAGGFATVELVDSYTTSRRGGAAEVQRKTAAARALVAQWLAAQNQGSFKGYEALYSKDYKGIKRAGSKTRVFHKGGWMKDRAKMFKGPLSVQAEDAEYTVASGRVFVAFTQTWESKKWKDTGPKSLVLAVDGQGMSIVSEEMVESFRLK
jgi:ketosteroid isomerase-like protein